MAFRSPFGGDIERGFEGEMAAPRGAIVNADVLGGGKDDGLTLVEVEVLVIVKGDRKAGKTRLGTIGQPMEVGKRDLALSCGTRHLDLGFEGCQRDVPKSCLVISTSALRRSPIARRRSR